VTLIAIKTLLEKDPPFFELVSNYEEYYDASHITLNTVMRLKLIEGWIENNSSVLDVGCGEGFIMAYLAKEKKCKVKGIDISKKAVDKVRKMGFEAVVRDIDLEGLGLKDDEFYDYILFIEVIEHLKYPQRVLLEACKHAGKGIIVTLPNSGHVRWRLQMLKGYFPRQSFTHLHFWSIKDFKIFLRTIGLEAVAYKTDLDYHNANVFPCKQLENLVAYQQVWLIRPW